MKLSKFAAIFFFSCFAVQSEARNVLLSWDSSISPEVVGYKLYVGQQPDTYTTVFDVGNTFQKTIENVLPGTYYYAVKGYNVGDTIETAFSNEQSAVVPVGIATFVIKSNLPMTLYQVVATTPKDTTTTRWEWKTTGALINNILRVLPSQVVFWYKLPGTYNLTLNKYVGDALIETITTPVVVK